MSELGKAVAELIKDAQNASVVHIWNLGKTQRSHGAVVRAQKVTGETTRALGAVTENAQTIVAVLRYGKDEFDSASTLQAGSAEVAEEVLNAAQAVIGNSTVEHTTSAITHLQTAKSEVDEGLPDFTRANNEVGEVVDLAGQLVETLGSAATTLATLSDKLEVMVQATYSSSNHVSEARTQSQSAVAELRAYLNDIG